MLKLNIGDFSYIEHERVICSGDACIIAGSDQAMLKYDLKIDPSSKDNLKI
ncbi:MAG: hypothetical protein GWP19_14645 [Planctomycetia bacterium]|nr:hypothetical protein [Planctomycetia bacterium]